MKLTIRKLLPVAQPSCRVLSECELAVARRGMNERVSKRQPLFVLIVRLTLNKNKGSVSE